MSDDLGMNSDGHLHGHMYLNSSPFHHDLYDCTLPMLSGPSSTLDASSVHSILTHRADNRMTSLPSLASITTSSNIGLSPTVTMPRVSSIPDSMQTTMYSSASGYAKLVKL